MTELAQAALWALHAGTRDLQAAGAWGILAMTLLFAVGAVSVIPRPALCVLAGAAFGFWGIPIGLAGATLGAVAAFGLGHALSPKLPHLGRRYRLVNFIFEAVRAEGWRLVVLLRLAPVAPASVQSFVFGVSSVRFLPYVGATIIGLLPSIVLETTLGATAGGGLRGDFSPWKLAFLAIGLLAGAAALLLVARRVRERMRADADTIGDP